jgi:demethylmenaquinone methyltransferase/2-methoxy-6-polyprenyl-1,4-benzoquinol methylase
MFDAIAPKYDLLNAVLSLNIHNMWRRLSARRSGLRVGDSALDVCAGTGDFAVELRRIVGARGRVIGVDFSRSMLDCGAAKYKKWNIETMQDDALDLPFEDNLFDAVTVGFGIRNVSDAQRAVCEMARVARPGGKVVVLEFSAPIHPVFGLLYKIYSRFVMPFVGSLVSGRRDAYAYLPESVRRWKSRDEMTRLFQNAGLTDVTVKNFTFGVACAHIGAKPSMEVER